MGDFVENTVKVSLHALPGPGTDLGAYRIIQLLGTGGMGQVFLAEHRRLGRKVALKLLLPQFATNAEVIARFFHEARAVNQINHQHIVEIVDFVEDPGGYNYFIMELLEGHDLASTREHEGPFSIARTVRIVRQIASALSATHAKGIVHRDLKPENIFLVKRDGKRDFVKLLDFGIAKLNTAEGEDHGDKPKTRAGMVLGTPEYMSPEQGSGKPIDHRSDLYSLGIIMYWMLSDTIPFRGDSLGEILVAQLTKQPPPLDDVAASGEEIPRDLKRLIESLLEKDPAKRPQSAQELLDRLSPLEGTDDAPLPPQRQRSMVVPAIAVGGALLAIAAAGIYGYSQKARPAPEVAAPEPQPSAPAALPSLPAPPSAEAPPAHEAVAPAPMAVPPMAVNPSKAEPTKSDSAKAGHSKGKTTKKTDKAAAAPAKKDDDNSGMIDPFAQ